MTTTQHQNQDQDHGSKLFADLLKKTIKNA